MPSVTSVPSPNSQVEDNTPLAKKSDAGNPGHSMFFVSSAEPLSPTSFPSSCNICVNSEGYSQVIPTQLSAMPNGHQHVISSKENAPLSSASSSTYYIRGSAIPAESLDLVDDIWVTIFHLLADDSKTLGRLLQVSRRFQRLIESDSSLWQKSYNLAIASSVFSPSVQQADNSSNYPWIRQESSKRSSYYTVSSCTTSTCTSGGMNATIDSVQSSDGTDPRRTEPQAQEAHEDRLAIHSHEKDAAHLSVPACGTSSLQLPSPLVLPHHQRKVQCLLRKEADGHGHGQASLSTQGQSLHLSVCQHSPSTVLMHHSPAEYWKCQVVEWLEQEKLRQLRLWLFWGLHADSSKNKN